MDSRRSFLLIGGTLLSSTSGCLGLLEDASAMELRVVNFEEDQVDAHITVVNNEETVFERDATYAANIDGDTEIGYGQIVEDAVDSRYTVEVIRHDNDRSVSQDIYLTCSPTHSVVVTFGWDPDEIDIEDSSC